MRDLNYFEEIYLYKGPVDMRKYRNGLCQVVEAEMGMRVFSPSLFVFTNRSNTIIRFLYWDETGFAIWSKTLDKQKYRWPTKLFLREDLTVSARQLRNILNGLDITPHKKLEYKEVF